jgi:hypothetical protein
MPLHWTLQQQQPVTSASHRCLTVVEAMSTINHITI